MYSVVRIRKKGIALEAKEKIYKGDLILKNLLVSLDAREYERIEKTKICKYIFKKSQHINEYFICFGDGAFVNHSDRPNLEKSFNIDNIGCWLYLRAIRTINPGEELTIQYTQPNFRLE